MKNLSKKLASFLLAAAMVVTAFTVNMLPAKAAETTIKVVLKEDVEAGKTIPADVVITNNAGLVSLKVEVNAPKGFTLVKETVSGQSIIKADNGKVFDGLTAGPRLFLRSTLETKTDGVLATVYFTADKNLAPGNYEFTAKVTEAFKDGGVNATNNITAEKNSVKVECNHVWDEGKITTEPTCTEDGVKTYTCACGETKTEVVKATGHTWDEGKVTTEPTCTEDGVKTYTCACGATNTEVVKATGHNYEDGKCTNCGEKEPTVTPDPEDPKDPADPTDKPTDPTDKPTKPSKPDTGDDANIALFAGLAILAAGTMFVLRRKEEL